MVDVNKYRSKLYGAPHRPPSTPRPPSGHERYRDPVVAPLQAAQRLGALEGWLEYTDPERTR